MLEVVEGLVQFGSCRSVRRCLQDGDDAAHVESRYLEEVTVPAGSAIARFERGDGRIV